MRVGSGVLAALAGIVALTIAGTADAGPVARPAKVSTLALRLGDRIEVAGTTISCVVQKSGTTVNFACVIGSLSRPVAHSYAVGIADKGADLAAVSASGGSAKLVTVVREPLINGARFVSPARRAKLFSVRPTTAILVGGTHIFCAVQSTDGTINVTCGLSSLAAHLQFPAGSYNVSESAKFALLGKVLQKRDFKTVAVRPQP